LLVHKQIGGFIGSTHHFISHVFHFHDRRILHHPIVPIQTLTIVLPAAAMSSGVRNLRAMFENQKGASSPEPRGRSPGDNTTTAEDEPARPTPKVRASFISVVPPTAIAPPDLGTAKVMPTNSTASHRRESFSVSQDNPEEIAELKKEVSDIREERRKSSAIVETVPERAVASRESSRGPPPLRDEPAGDIAGDIREETAQELHDEAVEDEAVEDLPEEPAADMANLGSIMKGSDFPEPAAAEAEKTPAQETPAQTPVQKETESAVVAKDDAPAQSQAPAKTEEKAAPAPKADAPALTPAEKEQKSVEAAKADAPTPSQTPAEPEEKPAVAPEAEASAQPGLLVEDKKETVVAASDDAPKLPSGTVEKPIVAPTDDTIALDETPTKAEPVPEPAAAPVEEAPVATETPTQSEEKTATPVNDAPVASATPAQTEGETSATEPVETPADNPDKVVTGVQEEVSMKPADLTDAATVSGGQALPPPVEALPVSSTPKAAAATPKPTESKAKTNGTPATKTKPEIKKPAAISTAKASTSRAAANKSPLPRAAPKTPTKPTTGASAAKPSPAASRVKPAVTKPTTAKAEVKPTVAKEPAKTAASTTAKEPTKAAAPKTSRASIRPGGLPTATASTTSAATKAKAAAPENKKPAAAKPAAPGSTSRYVPSL
jgi:hypothetical protein